MYKIVLVGMGGFLGTVARFLIGQSLSGTLAPFPFSTFLINVSGCFLIGIVYGLSGRFDWLTDEWRLFLGIGFCGGFTTFSTFANENILLIGQREYITFMAYAIGSLMVGLAAVWLGMAITK